MILKTPDCLTDRMNEWINGWMSKSELMVCQALVCVIGAKLDMQNPLNGWTALHYACQQDNIDVVTWVLLLLMLLLQCTVTTTTTTTAAAALSKIAIVITSWSIRWAHASRCQRHNCWAPQDFAAESAIFRSSKNANFVKNFSKNPKFGYFSPSKNKAF